MLSGFAMSGTSIPTTNRVIAIANMPSLNASTRPNSSDPRGYLRLAEGRSAEAGTPEDQISPSSSTEARSERSSSSEASIRSREKSVISRPSTIEYSPSAHWQG